MVSFANAAASKLNYIGFTNYFFDTTEDTVTYHNKPVMSYSSNGVHTTLGPYHDPDCQNYAFQPDYIQSSLHFAYAPGAIFNTAESFNCEALSTITRHPGAEMGQVVEFFLMGGTLGVGHANEPFTSTIIRDGIMYPSYQVGYSFIDAAWMGMPYLSWQNVFVGDPLTAIAWGKQTLTQNKSWNGTNLVTDTIFVTFPDTLTIAANSLVNLRYHGFITGDGILIVNDPVTFSLTDWSRALFISHDYNHPKLVWGNHPTIPSIYGFKIYRKIDNGNWSLIATVNGNKYTDETIGIKPPIGIPGVDVFYRITARISINQESDYSNEVEINGQQKKGNKISTGELQGPVFTYSLAQNYPNPFNPTTTINYSIKYDGSVQLSVFDILGRKVTELVNKTQRAGNYNIEFNASYLPSGIYFYQLKTGGFIDIKKMILLK